ncbi:MAG: AF1514 family protein [Betaproteobacteria bacterium]|nr:AF1514 family protein [Betaproteobacteria bacterium]
MTNLHIEFSGPPLNYQRASQLAREAAMAGPMREPTIMSWHHRDATMPYYDGANPETWWAKYGEGNGGRLEVSVGDDFRFVMMDTRAFDRVGEIPLRNLRDGVGHQYLCWTPMLAGSTTPNMMACNPLGEWMADQF